MTIDFDRLVTGIDHVQVAIPPGSEEACRAFYAGVLGLVEVEKPALLAARGGLWLLAGERQLHLGVEMDFRPAKKAHPAFSVWDAYRLADQLADAGHNVTWADDIPGVQRFHVHDPVGNRLEFVHKPRDLVEALFGGPKFDGLDLERSKDTGREVDLD
jgi:catechol 2,3-dioxygenase-like lactoylglutathione lyase family enzyme